MSRKSKFELIPALPDERWDEFVEASPQGTIFSLSRYLEALERDSECFYVMRGQEVKAALCYTPCPDEAGCELDDLAIHNGIMFKNDETKKETKARFERFEITEFIINELDGRMKRIELALAPQFEDLRPFLWHNYHSKDPHLKFETDLRYTSYLDISELASGGDDEATTVFRNMDTIRQRNIREAGKGGAWVEKGGDSGQFIAFYQPLLTSQGGDVSKGKLGRMAKLIDVLIESDLGLVLTTRNPAGEPIYVTVFCHDSKRAYYLFGAGDPVATERYKGTFGFWEGFKLLAQDRGLRTVDMEGVNSPQRGWFKLSFGGDLRPYYQVYKGNR
ncbi:MAG: GNAT family N-acetyltransferase [Proteobacteria bacterium]|nr:GNAT family N-acetyltransferase [Pseudomonadota bacterium]